ncbi:hypothetical protein AB0C28_44205 [Nonomuraea sp. NPDC048892]|uniref:hypothetical protein n=1 Tax=Nonomuraea sp. NPDC048892 TaxID=3154624 RepID=UPI0033DFB325
MGRRLAHTTSALGLVGALVVLVCGVFVMATPTTAFAATKTFSYTCQPGGPYTVTASTPITVTLTSPASVTAGQTFDLTVGISALTLAAAPQAATTVAVNLALTPSGGTVTEPTTPKPGAPITVGQTTVPAGNATYKVAVNSTTTGKISLDPGDLKLGVTSPASSTTTNCSTTSTEVLDVPIGTGGGGGGTGDDVLTYKCTVADDSITEYPADVDIKVGMTPPATATVNTDASITWTGTVDSTSSDPLTIPSGFPTTGSKVFVTIKPSGAGASPTATGEAALTNPTVGADLTTLPNVTIKVRPTITGTLSLTAGDLGFGTSSGAAFIKCAAPTTNLKTYSVTVVSGTASPSPTNTSPTPTNTSPRPTTTRTHTETVTPTTTRKSQTPKAGADTGAGGTMGPDGRLFILTGTGLVAAAAIGGLVMRRRSVKG